MVDGQEAKQDSKTTSANPQETSQKASKTYAEADLQKAVNDALAKAGRDAKALEVERARIKSEADAIFALRREQEQKEEETLKDKPDEFAVWKRNRELTAREKAIAEKETDINRRSEEIEATRKEMAEVSRKSFISELARTSGIDAKLLDKPYLKDNDSIADYAQTIASARPKANEPPDSGLANAGGGTPTMEQLTKWAEEEPEKYVAYRMKSLDPKRKS